MRWSSRLPSSANNGTFARSSSYMGPAPLHTCGFTTAEGWIDVRRVRGDRNDEDDEDWVSGDRPPYYIITIGTTRGRELRFASPCHQLTRNAVRTNANQQGRMWRLCRSGPLSSHTTASPAG